MMPRKLSALLLASLLLTSASATEIQMGSYTTPGQETSAEISLSADKGYVRQFSVQVPIQLPIHVNKYNFVTVGQDAAIVNSGNYPVRVKSFKFTPQNDWEIVTWSKNKTAGDKQVSFRINGTNVGTDGTATDAPIYHLIPQGQSLPLTYDARISWQEEALNESIANCTITVESSNFYPVEDMTVNSDGKLTALPTSSLGKYYNYEIPNGIKTMDAIFQSSTGDTKNAYLSKTYYLYTGNSLTKIPNYFAQYNKVLRSVTIGASVSDIGASSFNGCTSLYHFEVLDHSESYTLSTAILTGCTSLRTAKFGEGLVELPITLGGCTALKEVYLPSTLTTIKSSVFKDCTALTDVYYNGTVEQWNAISISSTANGPLLAATIHCTDGNIG